uniref:Uncharacterized protein n=1 Tax=Anguilla anguilla TaxID=7936 RepID=A0A0E9PVC4_ANGAN
MNTSCTIYQKMSFILNGYQLFFKRFSSSDHATN